MTSLKKKKYSILLLIVVLIVAIIGLVTFGKTDKYKGQIAVKNVNINKKVLSSVGNTAFTTSKGYDEVEYNVEYTLDEIDGVTNRDVIINASLDELDSRYAYFKVINKSNVECTLSNNSRNIELNISNVPLGVSQEIKLVIVIEGAPNGKTITPEINIKEATGEYTRVNAESIRVETNSIEGIVSDTNSLPVSNIELSIYKNNREIRRTYTDETGRFIFTDLQTGTYDIHLEEEIYELVGQATVDSNDSISIKVREKDGYNIKVKKYITGLNLKINGKENKYSYNDLETVVQSIKNAKTIGGEIEYKIVVENKGDKEGEVSKVIDEIQDGLSFDEKNNTGWEKIDDTLVYRPIEGSLLKPGEKREIKLVLIIKDTKEIKTYLNKVTSKGEIVNKVSYIVDGEIVKEQKVIEGEKIKAPSLDIDNLDAWYTDVNYTNKYNFKNEVRKDLILYGRTHQEQITHSVVIIDKNPETLEESEYDRQEIADGNKVSRPNTDPTHTGYTFKCWTVDNVCYDFDDSVRKDLVLVSKYDKNKYDVVFIDGGTEYNRSQVEYKDLITRPSDPSKEYYTFKYWSLETNGSEYDLTTPVTQNVTLYSVYEINKYNLKFIDDGNIIREETVDAGSIIQPETVSKTGYSFKFWSEDNTSEYNFANPIVKDTTLYSVYEIINYEIGYSLDGGTVTGNPTTYTIETETITLNNPTKEGYTFEGWTGSNGVIPEETVTIPKGSTGNKNYVANYTPISYNITYTLNGGSVTGNPNTYTVETETFRLNNPSKEGYTFTGWTGSNGDTPSDDVSITKGSIGDKTYTANFTPITYTISYDGITDEERESLSNPISYNIESNEITIANPQNRVDGDGDVTKIFVGWTHEGSTTPSINVTIPTGSTGDKLYTANWIDADPDTYPITYELNGGTISTSNPSSYTKQTDTFTLNIPSKEGYTFIGWTGSNGDTPEETVSVTKGTRGALTFTANYTPITYNITYNLTGGTVTGNPDTYTIETETITLNNPAKEGYTFEGWTGSNGDTPQDDVSIPKGSIGDKTYTANFTPIEYTISYELNGGNTVLNPTTYTIESEDIVLLSTSKEGYTFTGWTGSNGDTPEVLATLPHGSMGNKNYEANFTPITYNITYNLDGGSVTGNPDTYTIETETITLNNPSKEGYTFDGWTGSNGDTAQTSVSIEQGSTGDKTYTANYTPIAYTIEYDLDGGSVSTSNPESYTIETDTFTLNNPTKPGYTFTGWTGSNGDTAETTVSIEQGSTGNKNYVAHYEAIVYTLEYELNGGSVSTSNPESYTIETPTFTLNNPTKEGYNFVGWSGTGISESSDTVTIEQGSTGNRSYEANFEIKKYTVTFMNGTDIFKKVLNVEHNTKVTIPSEIPTKTHNVFVKWVDIDNNEYNFDTPVTSDLTLYAAYEEVEAPVITHTPTEWTKNNVTVTITSTHNDYTYMYKIGNGNYQTYSEPFEVSENTTVYAYSVKNTVSSVEVTHDITNIDKINPLINNLEKISTTPIKANVSFKLKDNESGIKKYKIYVDDTLVFTSDEYTTNLNEEKEEEYEITGLEEQTEYAIKVEAEDVVGNVSEDTISITTSAKIWVAQIIGENNTLFDDESNYIKFETLKEAIEYSDCVSNQCTIQMLLDVEESNNILDGQDITIDLNGKTITGTRETTFTNNGIFQVVDHNEDEVGKIVNTSDVAIENNGTLTIGENEEQLDVSKTEPIIQGEVYGVENNSTFKFFDGKIIGDLAVKGEVTETPYSFNASISDDLTLNKQVAKLEIIADAEARINTTYYTKLQGGVNESKNGTYQDVDYTKPLIEQFKTVGDYGFIYWPQEHKLFPENAKYNNTDALSYITLDLTNYEEDQLLTIEVSGNLGDSIYNYGGGFVTIKETESTPTYSDEDGRIVFLQNTSTPKKYSKLLEKGKVYYLYVGNHRGQYEYGSDYSFILNSITLGDSKKTYLSDLSNALFKDNGSYYFYKGKNKWTDLSGNGNDVTLANTTIENNSVVFNGVNTFGQLKNPDFQVDNEETVEIEFSLTKPNTTMAFFDGSSSQHINFGIYFWSYYGLHNQIVVGNEEGAPVYELPYNILDGTKKKAVITYKDGNYEFYYEGVKQNKIEGSRYFASDSNMYVGRSRDYGSISNIYNVKLYNRELTENEIMDTSSVTDGLKLNLNGEAHLNDEDVYINNNVYASNTTAASYLTIDLTNDSNDHYLLIDAEITSQSNYDLGYIKVTDNNDIPSYSNADVVVSGNVERKTYKVNLIPNKVNYVHFGYYKNGNTNIDTDTFAIYSIKNGENSVGDKTDGIMNNNGTYYFDKHSYNPYVWKDSSPYGNDATLYGVPLNTNEDGFEFDGSGYVEITGGISNTLLNTESVEVEFSTTSTGTRQLFYNGSTNEYICISIYDGYFIVTNKNQYHTFNIPADYNDGNKHTFLVTYDNGTYKAYFDKVEMEERTNNDRWDSNGNTYIGSRRGDYNFEGTLYSVKVYNRVLTSTEITGTHSNEGLILNLDASNSKKIGDCYISNNQTISDSTANSYMTFDLTGDAEDIKVYIDATISSQSNADYGYITVTDSTTAPTYDDTNGRYVFISGNTRGEYELTLEAGKVNYVHFGYYKNSGTDSYLDSFIINKIKYVKESSETIPVTVLNNETDENTRPYTVPKLNQEVDTVEVLRNITLTSPMEVVETRDVILDLNGYTITTAKDDYVIVNHGNLKIIDSDYSNQTNEYETEYNNEIALNEAEYTDGTSRYNQTKTAKETEYNSTLTQRVTDYNNDIDTAQDTYDQEYTNKINSVISGSVTPESLPVATTDGLVDYFDFGSFDNGTWKNLYGTNNITLYGTPSQNDKAVTLDNITKGTYATLPIDNSGDSTIYFVVKNDAYRNYSAATRLFEIYHSGSFNHNTPVVYSYNDQIRFGSYDNDKASTYSSKLYNVIALTIDSTNKQLKLYINGNYIDYVTYNNYGSTIYLTYSTNGSTSEFGTNSYKMLAVYNNLNSVEEIATTSNMLKSLYIDNNDSYHSGDYYEINSTSNEFPELFDGDLSTVNTLSDSIEEVNIKVPKESTMLSYKLYLGNDNTKYPTSIELKGSRNNGNYETIDTYNINPSDITDNYINVELSNYDSYENYKWIINSDNGCEIAEIEPKMVDVVRKKMTNNHKLNSYGYSEDNLKVLLKADEHGNDSNTWQDLSGNNNNFTVYNGTFEKGRLNFNGSSTYAVSNDDLNINDESTYEVTFLTKNVNNVVVDSRTGSNVGLHPLYIDSYGNYSIWSSYTNSSNSYNVNPYLYQIHTYTVVVTSTGTKLYIDGDQVSYGTGAKGFDYISKLTLGREKSSGYFLNGTMYTFRYYDRALSDVEISQNSITDKNYVNYYSSASGTEEVYSVNDYVQDELIVHYDARNKGIDPTIWPDLSGNGNDGTLSNVTPKTDAMYFNGTNSYVDVGTATNLGLESNTPISLEAVISYNQSIAQRNIISVFGPSGGACLGISNSTANLIKAHGNNYDYSVLNSRANMFDNNLHDVVATIDPINQIINIYIDGQLDSTRTFTTGVTLTDALVYVGRYYGGEYYLGNIHNVKIYNKALTENEVIRNYNVNATRYNLGNIRKKVATKQIANQKGKITSSTNSTILNDEGAYLNVDEAILMAEKAGSSGNPYSVIHNKGLLTIGDKGIILVRSSYSRGILNDVTGDILDGTGKIMTIETSNYADAFTDTALIENKSYVDKGFTGYVLDSTYRNTGFYNVGGTDYTINIINCVSSGNAIENRSNYDFNIKNSTIISRIDSALYDADTKIASTTTLSDVNAYGRVQHESKNKLIIKNSELTTGNNQGPKTNNTENIRNNNGIVEVDNSILDSGGGSGWNITNSWYLTVKDSELNNYNSGNINNSGTATFTNTDFNAPGRLIYNSGKMSYSNGDMTSTTGEAYNTAFIHNTNEFTIDNANLYKTTKVGNSIWFRNEGGGVLTILDNVKMHENNAQYGVLNYGVLTIGNKENSVKTNEPVINGYVTGVYNLTGVFNFYDGIITSVIDKGIYGKVNDMPNKYDLNIDKTTTEEMITLRSEDSTEENNYVAKIGNDKYTTIQNAINAASNNDTIVLLKDINTAKTSIIPNTLNVTIDYDNHYVKTYKSDACFENNGTLELTNNNTNPNDAISYSFSDYYIVNNNNLTISGNTIKAKDRFKDIKNNGTLLVSGGFLTSDIDSNIITNNNLLNITGGRLRNNQDYTRQGLPIILNNENATVNISGGDFYTNTDSGGTDDAIIGNHGTLNISGGTFGIDSDGFAIKNYSDGITTITDGNFNSDHRNGSIFHNLGNMNISNISSNFNRLGSNDTTGVITIDDVTMTALTGHIESTYNSGDMTITNSTFTHTGSVTTIRNAGVLSLDTVTINGLGRNIAQHAGTLNIKDSNFVTPNSISIYLAGSSDVTIEDANIDSYDVSICVQGGNWANNYEGFSPFNGNLVIDNVNATSSDSYAIYSDQNAKGTIDILSGIYTSTKEISAYFNSSNTLTINIGTKGDGVPSKTDPYFIGKNYGLYNSNQSNTLNIYDGIFIGTTPEYGPINEVETGYELIPAVDNGDGTYSRYLDRLAAVYNVEQDKRYEDIQEAINEANSGETLQVLREITVNATDPTLTIPSTKNIIFDLNGNTVFTNNEPFMINNGTLTCIDSKTDGNIYALSGAKIFQNNGTMEIISGIYKIKNSGNIVSSAGDLSITGGTFISDVETNLFDATAGTIDVSGGKFTFNSSKDLYGFIKVGENATGVISGGEFSKTALSDFSSTGSTLIENAGTLDVTGGTFNVNGSTHFSSRAFQNYATGTLNVTGGTYNSTTGYSFIVINYGTADITNITSNYGQVAKNYGGTLTIDTLTSENLHQTGECIIVNEATLDVIGGSYLGNSLGTTTFICNSGDINVDGITYDQTSGSEWAIRNSGSGTSSIINSLITIPNNGILMQNSSTLTLTNNTILANGTIAYMDNYSSANLIIESGGYVTSNADTNATGFHNTSSSTITIGKKDALVSQNNPSIEGTKYGIYCPNINGKLNFYDGIVTGSEDSLQIVVNEVEPGYSITRNEHDSVVSKYLTNTPIIKNKTSDISYTDIQTALDAATTNDELEILRELNFSNQLQTIVVPNKKLSIDLKEYTIYVPIDKFVENNGDITFKNGTIISQGTVALFDNYNNLELNNITVNNKNNITNIINNNVNSTIDIIDSNLLSNRSRVIENYGTITIDGNSLIRSEGIPVVNYENATLNLDGGEIYKTTSELYDSYSLLNYGTFNMTGGNIESHGYYGSMGYPSRLGYAINNAATGNVNITGGTFNYIRDQEYEASEIITNSGTASIKNVSTEYGILYTNSGTLTIENMTTTKAPTSDSNNSGTVSITNSTLISPKLVSNSNGSMTIDNVNLSGSGTFVTNNGNSIVTIDNINCNVTGYFLNSSSSNTSTINNSNITSTDTVIRNTGAGTVSIISGIYTSTNDNAIYNSGSGAIVVGTQGGVPNTTDPTIIGKNYGFYNANNNSIFNFYDGIIKGGTGSIYGTITETEPGYKEKRDNVVDPDTGDPIVESTLTVVGEEERIAVVNNVNFNTIQSAVNYAVRSSIPTIVLYKNVTLEDNLVKPDGINVNIYLNNYTITQGSYTIDPGITLVTGQAPGGLGGAIYRFFANITGQEINPKNIVIYQMSDGSNLEANKTYKLYKLVDSNYKVVKFNEDSVGRYETGNNTDTLRTNTSRIYINNLGEGQYRLLGSDDKELVFEISGNNVSSNIRINNSENVNRTSTSIATLILSLQTGVVRSPYILVIMIITIVTLSLIAYKKYKKED